MNTLLADVLARLEKMALDCGFSRTGAVDPAAVMARKEVREACASDKCHAYGKNWSCPPACGSLEECEKKIRRCRAGLVLQTTGSLEDSFDHESMERIGKEHESRLRAFQEKLQLFFAKPGMGKSGSVKNAGTDRPWLLLGSGGCRNCGQCTCPQSPCLFPEKMIVSVEAMGIQASELCKAGNIPYYYGPNTLTYIGCIFIK